MSATTPQARRAAKPFTVVWIGWMYLAMFCGVFLGILIGLAIGVFAG